MFFQRDSGAAGQKLQRLDKTDVLVFLDKADDIARFATSPTPIALAARIHVERGAMIIVKRTQALERWPSRAQRQVAPNDVYNVVGLFDLLDPIVRQRVTCVQGPVNKKSP